MPDKHCWVFRHGETDWNAEGRFQGHTDIPLNQKGRMQAHDLAERLRSVGLEAVLSSDLSRASETGSIVAEALGIRLFMDANLREAFLGNAQGLTFEEIGNRFGQEMTHRWRSDHPTDADVSYPGGETGAQVMTRSFEAIERFFRTNPEVSCLGVSCHGGVIRRLMQKVRPPGSEPVKIPNTVLYRLIFESESGEWRLG